MSYLVLKCPAFWIALDPVFQSFHFCCFYLFTSSTCAFLCANFKAFILVFLFFFTFSGSFGKIFNLSGILNYSVGYIFISQTFSLGLPMGLKRCSFTIYCVLYFLYLTKYPSQRIFSIIQGQNYPSPEQIALQCVPSLKSYSSGYFRTLRRQAGSSITSLLPYLLILAVCSYTSTSCTTEFFHFLSSCMKHLASFPISLAVRRSTLRGYALSFFSFSLRVVISSLRATSIFSFMASNSFLSYSSVSSRLMRRLIFASDFLSQMIEAQWSRMLCAPPSSSRSGSYLLVIVFMDSLIYQLSGVRWDRL